MSDSDGSAQPPDSRTGLTAIRQFVLAIIVLAGFGLIVFSAAMLQGDVFARDHSAEEPEAHCNDAQDCNRKSLQAYVRAAVASEGAGDIAGLQLVLGFFGLAGVGATVFYARQAWREAEKSARAAAEALDHTRQEAEEQARRFAAQLKVATDAVEQTQRHFEREQRPWIKVVIGIGPKGLWVDSDGSVYIDLIYYCKNIGKNPAMNVAPECDVAKITSLPPPEVDRIGDQRRFLERVCGGQRGGFLGMTLFPGDDVAQFPVRHQLLSPVDVAAARINMNGLLVVSIYGAIAYDFAEGSGVHFTRFCYEIHKRWGDAQSLIPNADDLPIPPHEVVLVPWIQGESFRAD